MIVLLHEMVETEDAFEVGACLGEIILEGKIQVDVDDPELKARLRSLLLEPLQARRAGAGNSLSTIAVELFPGDPGYFEALRERLQKRDYRIQAELLEE